MTVIGAGRYIFGKNISEGIYDLEVVSGEGSLWIYGKEDKRGYRLEYLGGENEPRSYKGIDSDNVGYFEINGNLKVSVKKAEPIVVGD